MKSIGTSSLFSGEEEIFAWARAVSRLSEMGTVNWSLQHQPVSKIGASDLVKSAGGDENALLVN